MALNLITGYAGIPHITSENDGAVNAALYGSERYVLNTGKKFAYEIISNNLIRIKDGYAMNQGRKIGLAISEYEDLTIDNGLQGVKRSDIIVIRYKKNLDTGIESADFVVVKGTSGDTYKDPALETGNIIQGDSVDDLPLYRVKIDGLSITTVEPMFNVLMSMQEMQEELTELNGKIVSLYTGAGAHNAIYRGKNLGNAVTDSQWQAISDGTFEDLYIGDYWVINGVNWRIASFDYYYRTGDTDCTTHHVVIVPDTALYTAQMNTSNVTTGAYVGSAMYTSNLANAKTAINNAFGSGHILSHRQYLQNATTNGYASACSWYDSTVELMTEQNVYGCKVFGNCINGTNLPNSYTVDKSQFPLFALDPTKVNIRSTYWLRDVASDAYFCRVSLSSYADYYYASGSLGVRPAFSIKS